MVWRIHRPLYVFKNVSVHLLYLSLGFVLVHQVWRERGLYELINWQYIWTLEMGRSMWFGFKRAKNHGSDMFVA